MDKEFLKTVLKRHLECTKCPPKTKIARFFNDLMGIMFPSYAIIPVQSISGLEERIGELKVELDSIIIQDLIEGELTTREIINNFVDYLPSLYVLLNKDIEATYEGDPAASNHDEIIRSYPGFYAIAAYRVAHKLWQLGVKTIPRIITEHAHGKTGIDIHPKATIGEYFCIDHGTGIVIGETTVIGKKVKLYQGVTLGALSVNKEDASTKRHPTIEDNVVIYAGATILGGNTVIGTGSIVGGNVWLTKSIPANSKVYYQAKMHDTENNKMDVIVFK